MNFRDPGTLALLVLGCAIVFIPGRGLMGPALLFGRPHLLTVLLLALVIFCVVYFGTLKIWQLLTGDRLPKPLPAVLAVFLVVRLTVDCARMLMWF